MKKRVHRQRAINRAVVEQLYHVEYGADQIRLASGAAAAGGALLSLTGFASDVSAATFTVTNTNDNGAGSLRQAVLDAEAAGGADTIVFQAGVTGTIQLTSGHILIYEDLAINGPGAATLSVEGGVVTREPSETRGKGYAGGVFQIGPPVDAYNGGDRVPDGGLPIVTIDGLTITGGYAGFGGNISNTYADLTVSNCVVSAGTAYYDGGGIFSSSTTRVVNSTVSGNSTVTDDGGGIYSGDYDGALLTVTDSTISGNYAYYEGGGIAALYGDVAVANSTLSGNTGSTVGGGIFVYLGPSGDFDISGSSFTGNDTVYSNGGGLAVIHTGGTVNSSTFSGNDAENGGGLFVHNHLYQIDLENLTVSGNTAADAGGGIALDANNDGTSLRFVTVTGNTAPDGSGLNAYYLDGIGNPEITNSVIAGNTGGNDFDGNLAATSVSFTAIGTENATFVDGGGNLLAVAPLLGVLADNGGPTMTHLPLAGSPLIDAADPAFVAPPAVDQRGQPRISGGRADMGAVETVAALVPEVPVPATSRTALAALAALIAAIGLTGLSRRMRGNAAALALLAAGLLTAGDPALAAKPDHYEVAFGTIASTRAATAENRMVEVALADGTRFTTRRGHLRVIDLRSTRATEIESLSDVAASQAVMVKFHRSARGRLNSLRVTLFDTVEAARAHHASRRSAH